VGRQCSTHFAPADNVRTAVQPNLYAAFRSLRARLFRSFVSSDPTRFGTQTDQACLPCTISCLHEITYGPVQEGKQLAANLLYNVTTLEDGEAAKLWKLGALLWTRVAPNNRSNSNEINRQTISQAGRRGFDPRLPLHSFSSLHPSSLYDGTTHLLKLI
jgi:hypothetical protein